MSDLKDAVNAVLDGVVAGSPRVPGVAAVVTNRDGVVWQGARGERVLDGGTGFTTDTVCAMYSTTKAIGGTAALQLVEEGKLDLDTPAREYLPRIGDLKVFDGIDNDGQLRLRAPRRAITTRHLLTHTAGLAYDSFNETYARLAKSHGFPSVLTATWPSLETPLLFDPGEQWEYGSSIDWAGMVVEAITGRRLGDVMKDRIFDPLGMNSTGFSMTEDMRSRMARIHARSPEDGSLTPMLDYELPPDPDLHMAGHGLYGTADDYVKFIRMWLDDGRTPNGEQILKPDTVKLAEGNHLPDGMYIKKLPGVIAAHSNDLEFFPGMPKTWGLTFMINDEDAPTGRPAGSIAWAGLANLYYWIDRRNGIGGFWATQILPFVDQTSVDGFLAFETEVYDNLPEVQSSTSRSASPS